MSQQNGHLYEFGEFRLDTVSRRLLRDGQIVKLTPKVFDLLVVLVENQSRILGKEELLRTVWPDAYVEEGNLAQNISVLRNALAAGTTIADYIDTIPRQGYRFIAPVREIGSASEEIITADRTQTRLVVEEENSSAWWRWGVFFGLAVVVLAGAATWLLIVRSPATRSHTAVNSLVVLPFVNLSADKDNEYFSDGLTEELINALSHIDGLRVVARTTAFQFKGKAQDIRAIGQQLGVAAVLEGSVRKEQNRLRVTVQLNSVTDGFHLWSKTYDRVFKEVFVVQEEIAEAVRQRVRQNIRRPPLPTERQMPKPEAYDLYLLGRYHGWRRGPQDLRQATEYFERAIELEPDFAAAYAGLALAWGQRGVWGGMGFREVEGPSRRAALKAVELDANLAEAHAVLGIGLFTYDWDWAGAEHELQKAIHLDPNSLIAYKYYSQLLMATGRFPEAMAHIEQAVSLDPLSSEIRSDYGRVLFRARRFDEAGRQFRRAIDLDPLNFTAYVRLGEVYEQMGRFQEALEVVEQGLKIPGADVFKSARVARAYALLGRRKDATEILDRLARSDSNSNVELALVSFALGDNDRGFDLLKRAFDQRELVIFTKFDPRFDGVRSDPRFRSLVARMNLPY
jgi:TolB-like protein/DNA-binding winged helix-turn-helix (wHTH) protein/Flp pilus assembly protein TadD